jgi:hypothetical protein
MTKDRRALMAPLLGAALFATAHAGAEPAKHPGLENPPIQIAALRTRRV